MKKWTTKQMLECLDQGPTGNIGQQAAAELRRLHEVNQELVKALEAYFPFIPITSAKEGGASAFSENVRAADMFRAALAKATGGQA